MENDTIFHNIGMSIKSFRELFELKPKDFIIPKVEITKHEIGVIDFYLPEKMSGKKVWTAKELNTIKKDFYKEIQDILMETEYDFIVIATKRKSKDHIEYELTLGHKTIFT
jgi:hypothetical protein